MGCDIHFYVERCVGGLWVAALSPETIKPSWCSEKRRAQWHVSRSYVLFGVLAGVRGNWIENPIEPRDIPEDCSPLIRKEFDRWECDAHTPSHISLEELIQFESINIEKPLYFNIKDYMDFKKDKDSVHPINGLIVPQDNNIISVEEMDRASNLMVFSNNDDYKRKYVKIEASYPISAFLKEFWETQVSEMKKLHKDPSKVRCVFWFDN